MARFFSDSMIATVPADYASTLHIEGANRRPSGKWKIVDDKPVAVEVVDVDAEQTWVEVPLKPPCAGWAVAARIGLQANGAPAISELRIFPREAPMMEGDKDNKRPPGLWCAEVLGYRAPFPPGGLSSAVLRKIGLKWLLGFAASRVHGWEKEVKALYGRLPADGTVSGLVFELQRGKRGRPRLYDDALLLRVARLYVEGSQVKGNRMGKVRSVRQFLADKLRVPPERARDLVKTARVRGFLQRTSHPGRAGGMLTPRAEELVRSVSEGKRRRSGRRAKAAGG